jgi:DNA polymerase III subunit delta
MGGIGLYYIFHGEDGFTLTEELKKLRARMGDPQFADLNTTFLDGRTATFGELRHHADAIPFLADKRLVIVEGMIARLNPRQKKNEGDGDEPVEEDSNPELGADLSSYLPDLPETTRLIFVEGKALPKTNPILKLAEKDDKNARVRLFSLPRPDELIDWIVNRVEVKAGRIEFSAANDLAMFVGADLRALDNELEKLITYRAREIIRRQDVVALVAPVQEQSIFELADAIGKRDTPSALELLHEQLNHNAQPLYLLAMIARQFRMLLQVRDLAARGLNLDQIRAQLGLHPYVARKVLEQSRNFSIEQLETIYRKLLETDISMKTSHGDPAVNLDVLVVEVTK